jgi:hypothetical protein
MVLFFYFLSGGKNFLKKSNKNITKGLTRNNIITTFTSYNNTLTNKVMKTSRTQIENFIIAKRNPSTAIQAIKENPMLAIICNMHEDVFLEKYNENPSIEQLTNIVFNQISSFENYNG